MVRPTKVTSRDVHLRQKRLVIFPSCNHLWRSFPSRVLSHALFNFHSSCIICFAGNTTGAARFSGSKTEQIVDRTPFMVLFFFFNSKTLKSYVFDSMCHRTPSVLSTGNLSRLTPRDGSALFPRGIEAQTLRLLLVKQVKSTLSIKFNQIFHQHNCTFRHWY